MLSADGPLPMNESRRSLLRAALASAAFSGLPGLALAGQGKGLRFGAPTSFSFQWLRKKAMTMAQRPYEPVAPTNPELLHEIDYDAYQKIAFRDGHALWRDDPGKLPATFFHLGRYFQQPVAMHVVTDATARKIHFDPTLFRYQDDALADRLPEDLGFAGFRVHNPPGTPGDWLAFLGASYFRCAGPGNQYGLSARGIAIDTEVPGKPEQFPRFRAFWLEQRGDTPGNVRVYALLDGQSVTGAYRFDCHRNGGAAQMDVHAELFQRESIDRLGIAPLTSMYWYSETNHRQSSDWRPEIHDSDGLALWTGAGERIWRPLNAPPVVQTNSFVDDAPKGFGLLQRDRDFDHYQDDGVFYNRRPSLWVEPQGDWGKGAVILIEIPTNDETEDNIVAMWSPAAAARAGKAWSLNYRLHWVSEEPYPPSLARVIATRIGRSGVPGQHAERAPDGRKFVIDFRGGPLAEMAQRYDLEVVVECARGESGNAHALKVVDTDYWRASFDYFPEGDEAVNLRCHLKLDGKPLTETWTYQYFPGTHPIR